MENPIEDESKPPPVDLLNIEVTDDNVALNLIVSFLNLAQSRGAYTFEESSKIWDCIQRFVTPVTDA